MTTSNWRGNGESSTSILAPLGQTPEQRRGDDDLPEGRLGPVCESTILELAVGKHYGVTADVPRTHVWGACAAANRLRAKIAAVFETEICVFGRDGDRAACSATRSTPGDPNSRTCIRF